MRSVLINGTDLRAVRERGKTNEVLFMMERSQTECCPWEKGVKLSAVHEKEVEMSAVRERDETN